MQRFRSAIVASAAFLPLLSMLALSASPARADEKPSPAFDRLKALAGDWKGTAKEGGSDKALPAKVSVRLVSGGSAVMMTTDPGGPHEMVTLFHRDDDAVIATHYCGAQNQPRLRLQPAADPETLAFEFFDGTNLGAHPGRMQRLELGLGKPDRHTERWTFSDGGQLGTMEFDVTRTGGGKRSPRKP